MTPAEQLKDEHEGIALMLTILEKVCAQMEKKKKADQSHLERIIEFFKVFVDQCHHGKEEVTGSPGKVNDEANPVFGSMNGWFVRPILPWKKRYHRTAPSA